MQEKPYKQQVIQMVVMGVEPRIIREKTGCNYSYITNIKKEVGRVHVPFATFDDIGSEMDISAKQAKKIYASAMDKMGLHLQKMGVDKECLDIFDGYRDFKDW